MRAAGLEPLLQLLRPGLGPGREREPQTPGAQASRARSSRPARPTDHERLLLREQPRRRADSAAPLSPSRRARAPRGEVSLRRESRGRAAPLGAPRPPPPLAGQTGKFVGELQATTSGK